MLEVLLFIVIIFLIINIVKSKSRDDKTQELLYSLNFKISELQKELFLRTDLKEQKSSEIVEKPLVEEKPIVTEEAIQPEIVEEIYEEPIVEKPIEVIEEFEKELQAEPTPYVAPTPIIPEKSWFETFKENNPDLEKFIGENLINKLGILILVLGISFFVKYAIDKDWINEPARVGIGILCGALVMAVAHKLKKNYAAFSSVLVAGAISIFYFTIAIAFHEYQLFSQTIAFIIMIVITIFSVLVSVSYNRQELAVLSLIGGSRCRL